jgi:hypothetical protein
MTIIGFSIIVTIALFIVSFFTIEDDSNKEKNKIVISHITASIGGSISLILIIFAALIKFKVIVQKQE